MSELVFLAAILLFVALPYDRLLVALYYHSKAISQRLDHANFFFFMAKLPFVKAMSYVISCIMGYLVLYLEQVLFGYFWLQLSIVIGATLFYIWSPFNRFRPRGVFWFYMGIYAFLSLAMVPYYLLVLAVGVLLTRSWVLGLISTFGIMFGVMFLQSVPTEYYFIQFWMLFVVVLRYLDDVLAVLEGGRYPSLDHLYFSR